ncbi:MAG: MgtC/SapB family protein [Gudongella sp.]|nr:MgtC/SapB family protein [Gudongella sp.]
MPSNMYIVFRLLLSAFVGGAIGIEREANRRPAGLRTHILVSVGSTLIMMVSLYAMPASADPSRIAAQVVSGIGFLGAGTIIITGNIVKGLTTAASLWVCAGIGLAIGSGYYVAGLVTAAIVLISLVALSKFEKNILRGANKLINIRAEDRAGLLGEIGTVFGIYDISIRNIEIDDAKEDKGYIDIKFFIRRPLHIDTKALYDSILGVKSVKTMSFDDESD